MILLSKKDGTMLMACLISINNLRGSLFLKIWSRQTTNVLIISNCLKFTQNLEK